MSAQIRSARALGDDPYTSAAVITSGLGVQLAAHGIFAFNVKKAASVACIAGELWVTGPGIGDRVLRAGEVAEVHARGRIVVEALIPSVLSAQH